MLAVVFSMSFFACGNKEAAATETVVEEAAVVEQVCDSTCTDSLCQKCDSTCEKAAEVAEVVEAPAAE